MPSSAARSRPTPSLAIVLLSVAAFASAANMRVIDPLLVQLAAAFDVTVGEASIAATAFLFANGVFVLVHGPFGDRYGMIPVVAIACIAAALCCSFSALAPSLGWLTLARFLTGVTSSAIIPLAIAWVGDNVSYERRQATLARFLSGQTLGLMTGAALGGAIGDWLGWRSVFWVLATIYIAAGVALFAVMRVRPDMARPEERARGSMIGQMLAVLRRRWALTVILVVALEGGMFWGAFTFVSTDLHQRFGLGFAAIGLAVAAFGGGGFLYVMVAHHLVRLLGERGLCILGRQRPRHRLRPDGARALGRGRVRRHRALRRVVLHVPQHAADQRHADGARGARRRHGAVRALPVHRPGDRRADRRPDRRPLGCAAGILGGGRRTAGAGLLVRRGVETATRIAGRQFIGDTRNWYGSSSILASSGVIANSVAWAAEVSWSRLVAPMMGEPM